MRCQRHKIKPENVEPIYLSELKDGKKKFKIKDTLLDKLCVFLTSDFFAFPPRLENQSRSIVFLE